MKRPTARPQRRLVIPFQHVQHQHAQGADKLVELLPPQSFDLLGKIVAIERIEAAVAQVPRLLQQPGIKVALVFGAHCARRRAPDRLGCLCGVRPWPYLGREYSRYDGPNVDPCSVIPGRPDDRHREAIQVRARSSGLLRRHSPSKTGVNALLPRNDEIKSRSRGAFFVGALQVGKSWLLDFQYRSRSFGFFLSLPGKRKRKRNAGRR